MLPRLRHFLHVYVTLFIRLRQIACTSTSLRFHVYVIFSHVYVTLFVRLRHADDITQLEPREIVERGPAWVDKFIEYHTAHLPDVSDRPEIKPESIQFWMMPPEGTDATAWKCRRGKTRFPAAHSRLKGMRAR